MSKSGVESQALKRNGVNAGQADQSFGTIAPAYTRLTTGTAGYTPGQLADMQTSALQSTSGKLADASGLATLAAARTGNAGASTAALDDIARAGTAAVSDADLGISRDNANLEQQNMRFGLSGLTNLYGDANSAADANLGTAANASASRRSLTGNLIGNTLGLLGTGYANRNN